MKKIIAAVLVTLLLTALVWVVPTSAAEESELPPETAASQEEEKEPGEIEEAEEPSGEESGETDDEDYVTVGGGPFSAEWKTLRQFAEIYGAALRSVPAAILEGPNLLVYIIPFLMFSPLILVLTFFSGMR